MCGEKGERERREGEHVYVCMYVSTRAGVGDAFYGSMSPFAVRILFGRVFPSLLTLCRLSQERSQRQWMRVSRRGLRR